jgi:hypothetical protein
MFASGELAGKLGVEQPEVPEPAEQPQSAQDLPAQSPPLKIEGSD